VFEYLSLGERPIVLLSEPDEIHALGDKLTEQIRASYEEAVAKGLRAAAPDQLIVDWSEARARLAGAVALESLEIAVPDAAAGQSHHVSCQPALEFSG
jgi:hypothetical protein